MNDLSYVGATKSAMTGRAHHPEPQPSQPQCELHVVYGDWIHIQNAGMEDYGW